MALSIDDKIKIYRDALDRYEADGDAEKVAIQRLLIARLEADKSSKKGKK